MSMETQLPDGKKKFTVAGFIKENSVEVIPSNWIISNTEAKWPNLTSTSAITKCIKQCTPFSKDWSSVEIEIYGNSNSFIKAKKMAMQALESSNVESDSSEERGSSKKRKPAKFGPSFEELLYAEHKELFYLDSAAATKKLKSSQDPSDRNYQIKTPVSQTQEQSAMQQILEYLQQIDAKLDQMDKKIDTLTDQVNSLVGINALESAMPISFISPDIELPLTSEDDLIKFNDNLKKDRNMAETLVRYLYGIGNGKTASAFILNICKKVLVPELAVMYSRYGRKGKKSFSFSFPETQNVIIAAATMKFPQKEGEFSDMFGKALAGACDWNGRGPRSSDKFLNMNM